MGDYDASAHEAFFGPDRYTALSRGGVSNALYYLNRALGKVSRKLFPKGPIDQPYELSSVDEAFYKPFLNQLQNYAQKSNFDCVIVTYVLFSKAIEAFGSSVHKIIDTHDSIRHYIDEKEEVRGLLRADTIVAIQAQEAELFAQMLPETGAPDIHILSHITEIKPIMGLDQCAGATFLGSSFEANRQSIRYFIDDVLPLILKEVPEFKLFVGGSICRDIEDAQSITKLGFVDDIRDAFAQAPLSLNPIVQGTGVKIKLIDSLGMALPIVSTEFGVMGLPRDCLQGVSIVKDGDPHAFATAVIALYRDAHLRREKSAKSLEGAVRWNEQQKECLVQILSAHPKRGKIHV